MPSEKKASEKITQNNANQAQAASGHSGAGAKDAVVLSGGLYGDRCHGGGWCRGVCGGLGGGSGLDDEGVGPSIPLFQSEGHAEVVTCRERGIGEMSGLFIHWQGIMGKDRFICTNKDYNRNRKVSNHNKLWLESL